MDETKKKEFEEREAKLKAESQKIEEEKKLIREKERLDKILARQQNDLKKTEEEIEQLLNPPPKPVFTRPRRTPWWKRVSNRLRGYSNV